MKRKKIIYIILIMVILVAGFLGWKIFGPTVSAPDGKYFYVRTGETYPEVKEALVEQKIIGGDYFFDLLARRLKYPNSVRPGRYEIKGGMSVYGLLRMLRLGNQSPVNLVITKLRTKEDLAQKISRNFECDSIDVIRVVAKLYECRDQLRRKVVYCEVAEIFKVLQR